MNGALTVFRLLMCIVIAASSLMAGMYFSARLTRRERQLGDYMRLLQEASSRISYSGESLAEAFSENPWGYSFRADMAFAGQWSEMLNSCADALNAEDIELLNDFAGGLGSTDISSQLKHIAFYKDKLGENLDAAKRDSSAKASVYRGLPFAAGMALVILII